MASGDTDTTSKTAPADELQGSAPSPDATQKRGRGQPTVWLDPAVEMKLFEALSLGVSRNKSAYYAGIHPDTLYERLKKDPEFSERVRAHEAAGIVRHARRIDSPETFDPGHISAVVNASKFYLTTHDRESWTERQEISHSGTVSIASIAIAAATPAETEGSA